MKGKVQYKVSLEINKYKNNLEQKNKTLRIIRKILTLWIGTAEVREGVLDQKRFQIETKASRMGKYKNSKPYLTDLGN